jgi:hypothetical protein
MDPMDHRDQRDRKETTIQNQSMHQHARNHNSNARNAQLDHPDRKAQTARWDHEARMANPDQHRHPADLDLQVPQVPLVTLADQDLQAQAAFPVDPVKMVFADVVPMDRKDQRVDQVHQARTVSQVVVALMARLDPAVRKAQLVALANQARLVKMAHQVVRDCPAMMPHTARAHRDRPSSSARPKCVVSNSNNSEISKHHVARTH